MTVWNTVSVSFSWIICDVWIYSCFFAISRGAETFLTFCLLQLATTLIKKGSLWKESNFLSSSKVLLLRVGTVRRKAKIKITEIYLNLCFSLPFKASKRQICEVWKQILTAVLWNEECQNLFVTFILRKKKKLVSRNIVGLCILEQLKTFNILGRIEAFIISFLAFFLLGANFYREVAALIAKYLTKE